MKLVSNVIGYRLAMTEKYAQAESLKVYKGLVGKLMVKLNLAYYQQLIDETGKTVKLAIHKRSLGHYVWRHNRCRYYAPKERIEQMQALYKISHLHTHKKYSDYICYTKSMSWLLEQRGFYNHNRLELNDFLSLVNQQAPIKGHFYKIKNDEKTVGYLLGTMHRGYGLMDNLNPQINKALEKSRIVAGETILNKPLQDLTAEQEKVEIQYGKAAGGIMELAKAKAYWGTEKCILRKIKDDPKEHVGLETNEEREKFLKLVSKDINHETVKEWTKKEKLNPYYTKLVVYGIFLDYLLGKEFDENEDNEERKIFPEECSMMDERNYNMAVRAEGHMKRARTFIAVGEDHLHGKKGIKSILISKGYSLVRV